MPVEQGTWQQFRTLVSVGRNYTDEAELAAARRVANTAGADTRMRAKGSSATGCRAAINGAETN